MSLESRCRCVLDTNVIYPLEIRDLLFWFAFYDLFVPKWSIHIFEEWKDVMQRKRVSEKEIIKRTERANLAFPDALFRNYSPLIVNLILPDLKDRHVLAAAIQSKADIIVTNNIKDFPADYLSVYGIKAKTAVDFLSDIIDSNPDKATAAFKQMVLNRKNPNLNELQLLEVLTNRGLEKTSFLLAALL